MRQVSLVISMVIIIKKNPLFLHTFEPPPIKADLDFMAREAFLPDLVHRYKQQLLYLDKKTMQVVLGLSFL